MTVAVLGDGAAADRRYLQRDPADFKIEWFQSLGAGGQNANKHQNCCRIVHLPTGIKQEHRGKSRESNLKQAKESIIAMLDANIASEQHASSAADRKQQVGSGMRGDKIRTVRFQDNTVVDHRSGKRMETTKYMRGYMDLLWST